MKLLTITKDGYEIGDGINPINIISHETLIALLTGLVEQNKEKQNAFALSVNDSANYFRQVAENIAWKNKVCSFNKDHQPITYNPDTPRLMSE